MQLGTALIVLNMQTWRVATDVLRQDVKQIFFPCGSCVLMIDSMACNQTGNDLLADVL